MKREFQNIIAVRVIVIILAVLLHIGSSEAVAQIGIKKVAVPPVLPDTADLAYYGRKNRWRPVAEVVGLNIGLWAYDRWVLNAPGARINIKSMKRNLTSGFKWDSDMLGTNTFLHPYHGSLYFNAGRSNGYNFWQSEFYAIGGSLMWELFMENEYPSINDFVATPIGGAVMGETLFRASDAVLDDRTTGWNRFGREVAGFIISPMRGVNRIVTGQAWHVRSTSGHLFGTPPIVVRMSAGPKMTVFEGNWRHALYGAALQVDMEYGWRFEPTTKPYDYFTVKAQLQTVKGQPLLNRASIKGRLLGRTIKSGPHSHASIGFYQHYDYFDSDTIDALQKVPYKLGIPASLGAGAMYRYTQDSTWSIDGYAHANAVILGGVLSDHYCTNKRNYNWVSGFSLKGGLFWVFRNRMAALSIQHEYYRLFTWKGYKAGTDLSKVNYRTLNVMGDKSATSFNVTEIRFDHKIWRNLYASLVFECFFRSTNYRDFGHHTSKSISLRAMASYKF